MAGGTGGSGQASGGTIGSGGADVPTGAGGAAGPDVPPDAGPADSSAAGGAGGSPVDQGSSPDAGSVAVGGPITTSPQHLDIGVHDPSMIWSGNQYLLFTTGGTLAIRTSPDDLHWADAGKVFTAVPAWIAAAIGSAPDGLWAPDISSFGGTFHLYYAGSTFGSNASVIGQATSPTLDPASPRYHWTDLGRVVQSTKADNFNAIDPNVVLDAAGTPWLVFGSFWDGIRLRKLDVVTGMPATDDPVYHPIASRGGGAIEGPSIILRGGSYYLFVSFDACCQGAASTYRTMAGRATAITGPYLDRSGKNMMQGGGDQLIASSGRYIGPGGGTAWKNGATYLYTFHYYDGQDGGISKLQIRPIGFTQDGWPTLGAPLFP